MSEDEPPAESPDLAAWRRRHELRKSSAAQPIPSGKTYQRKTKHPQQQERRDHTGMEGSAA